VRERLGAARERASSVRSGWRAQPAIKAAAARRTAQVLYHGFLGLERRATEFRIVDHRAEAGSPLRSFAFWWWTLPAAGNEDRDRH